MGNTEFVLGSNEVYKLVPDKNCLSTYNCSSNKLIPILCTNKSEAWEIVIGFTMTGKVLVLS